MVKLSKAQLDSLSTLLGLTAAISTVLVHYQWISDKVGGTITGVALAVLGYLTNKPASAHPTTSEIERVNVNKKRS